jgi:glutamate synthase domain-containing protein 3
VLENWADLTSKFIKVFPHDYKRVLGIPNSSTAVPAAVFAKQRTVLVSGMSR